MENKELTLEKLQSINSYLNYCLAPNSFLLTSYKKDYVYGYFIVDNIKQYSSFRLTEKNEWIIDLYIDKPRNEFEKIMLGELNDKD